MVLRNFDLSSEAAWEDIAQTFLGDAATAPRPAAPRLLANPNRIESFVTSSRNPAMYRAGRTDLCPCGSGKKFKKCCGR